jgi:hypothetical protein
MQPFTQSRVTYAPARRQGFARSTRRLAPPLTAARAPAQRAISSCLTQLLRSFNNCSNTKFLILPVAVMAEPGVGKSRLFHEFKLISQSDWTILEAFSISHGKASSYLPVIELLKDYFEIQTGDDERKRRERVNGKIITLDRSLEDTLPYLFTLLSLNAGDRRPARPDGCAN